MSERGEADQEGARDVGRGFAGLISDAPLTNPDDDVLGRRDFTRRLARTLAQPPGPDSLVVGLYGAWGTGKTTLLNFVAHELRSLTQSVVTVRFEAWRFSNETEMLVAFFAQLASALDQSVASKGERFAGVIADYVAPFIPAFGLGPVSVDVSERIRDLAERLGGQDLEQRRDRVNKMIADSGKRVVVLVDDLDRLDKSEVFLMLKLIKSLASFDGTTYVLTLDAAMVASSLGERYGSGTAESGREFLEKIVQVPLAIPAVAPERIRSALVTILAQRLGRHGVALTQSETDELTIRVEESLSSRVTTIRSLKRYANVLDSIFPLVQGEVDVVDFVLMEGLRLTHPSVHTMIRDNATIFARESGSLIATLHSDEGADRALIDTELSKLREPERGAIRYLLAALFPKARKFLGQERSPVELRPRTETQARVGDPRYFWRYFSYGLRSGELSEVALERILKGLESNPPDDIAARIRELVTPQNRDILSTRFLRISEQDLRQEQARTLAIALSASLDAFAEETLTRIGRVPIDRVAIAIHRFIYSQPPDKRIDLAAEVAEIAASTPLLCHVLRIEPEVRSLIDQSGKADPVSSYMEAAEFRSTVGRRIEELACHRPPFFVTNRLESYSVFWAWREIDPGASLGWLTGIFEENKAWAVDFLGMYLPISLTTSRPAPRSDAMPYSDIATYADPSDIASALEDPSTAIFDDTEGWLSPELREYAAKAFLAVHQSALDEEAHGADGGPHGAPT